MIIVMSGKKEGKDGFVGNEILSLFPLNAASHAGVLDLVDGAASKDCVDRRA